jgi:hypothetical protein
MLYPLTTEMYPTLNRTLGFGWSSGIGRMGATLIPFLIFNILEYDLYSPFYIFAIVSFIGSIASFTLPYDTTGRKLDQVNDNDLK